ncbi:MAG TPA: hypothetical protein VM716_05710 [Gemmatimonadales bacterium]|nr:hypothetical protein [Gemmatimonadales bacterium]
MTLDMTPDGFEEWLREAARDYHRPPSETPREELWQGIVAAQAARRRRMLVLRSALRWGVGIAAVLVLGIGIGRWTAKGSGPKPTSTVARGGPADQEAFPYRVAAAQYLTRAEVLLTGFRSEARLGQPDAQLARQARDLLGTTRLFLDCPAGRDPRLKGLLEDLEPILAQIAQLSPGGDREDVQLIDQGLEQRRVLLRLRVANPAGPGPVRTQGAL